jgi:transketolase
MSATDMSASVHNTATSMEMTCINTIRTLSYGRRAGSQIRGIRAPRWRWRLLAYTLVAEAFLRFDPNDPLWPNRDRFVLSIGPRVDAALFGTASRPEVKVGRQVSGVRTVLRGRRGSRLRTSRISGSLDSKLPWAPGIPPGRSGVETTTGPLGQGVATSVGMAVGGPLAGDVDYQPAPASRTCYGFDVYRALAGTAA